MRMKNPPHPGRLVKDTIEEMGLTVAQAGEGLGVTRQQLYKVINCQSAISPEMAVRLEKAIGSTADAWLRMQAAYDLAEVRQHEEQIVVRRLAAQLTNVWTLTNRSPPSVPEVPVPGEHHREARRIGGLDHLVVAHRAAGLDDGGGAGLGGGEETVGKREESVGRDHRILGERRRQTGGLGGFCRLPGGDARGIDAAHLAGADADRRSVLGIDDRIRFDVFCDTERKFEIGEFAFGGRALGHHFQLHVVDDGVVAALDEHAAGNRAQHQSGSARIGQPAGQQQPQVLFRRDECDRLVGGIGCDDDFREDLDDFRRGFGIELAVQRDDAAEGRDGIAAQRLRDRLRAKVAPSATPHGLACLMIATAALRAASNSATHSKAASVSPTLL